VTEQDEDASMSIWKELARTVFRRIGYRVTRLRPSNRFQATDETLMLMKSRGYEPRVVIDGGANVGDWTRMARAIFPTAAFHLVEPQPACARSLEHLVRSTPGVYFHPVAVAEPGITSVRMIGTGTGAWVVRPVDVALAARECPATTLDALLADRVSSADRALLKLDLEGHEISALRGAPRLLPAVEVILTELQFYEINQNRRPVFADVLSFLAERGFELYDFACLSPRPRDMRLRMGDVVFVRSDSPLLADRLWE